MKKIYLLILFLIAINASAQLVLITVGDKSNLKPIESANVIYKNKLYITDENGELILNLKSSSDTIIVKCIGYIKQVFIIRNGEKNIQFLLEKNIVPLKEVVIETYKEEKLCEWLTQAFNKTLKQNKSSKSYIETYTLGEDQNPIEYIKGYYNLNFEKGRIQSLKLKLGQLIFPYEDIENNFLSYSNSVLLLKSNPFFSFKDTQFLSPLFFKQKILLKKYHLSFKRIDDSLLLIICKNKTSNYITTVLLNKFNLIIEEISNNWVYNNYYPLVSINAKKSIQNTLMITSSLYFRKNKFFIQNLKLSFTYDQEKINTLTTLNVLEEDVFYEPNNDLNFNNDYYDIISKPKYPENVTKKLFDFNDTTSRINKAFNEELFKQKLTLSNKFDAKLFEDFTKIIIPENDFVFDWNKIPSSSKNNLVLNSGLKTFIFSDFICIDDSLYFNVKPYIDYLLSQYNYDRTPLAEHYLKNFYYLAKIYANSLQNELNKKLKKCPSNIEFEKITKEYNDAFEKAIWKYYFEVNAGENRDALNKWDEFILSKLEF